MAGKVKPAVPVLVPYPIKDKVRLAGALALRELGLVEKLREVMAKQEEDEKQADTQAHASSITKLAGSPDVREDEAAVMEEIFNTPDVDASGGCEKHFFLAKKSTFFCKKKSNFFL